MHTIITYVMSLISDCCENTFREELFDYPFRFEQTLDEAYHGIRCGRRCARRRAALPGG